MTCQECRDLLLEVARRRAAPFVEREVRAHAAACPDCHGCLERETALSAGLRALADADGPRVSPDVEARLMAAFAAQHVQPGSERPGARAMRRWLPLAAAVVVCSGAAAWWLERTVPVVRPAAPVARAAPSPPLAVARPAAGVESSPGGQRASRSERGSRPARRALRAAAPDPVQAVGFVPIPSAAGLPDFESGEIVRRGIEVTALPNYGLEIPSGAQATIQADFLVGQDGQARAIRLVNANAEGARPRQ